MVACSLADITPLPEGAQIPVCITEGQVQYNTPEFTNVHLYTRTVSSHPNVHITDDLLHPNLLQEDDNGIYLPVTLTVWRKMRQTLYEKGAVEMFAVAANPNENQGHFVLELLAKQILSFINLGSKFISLLPGYSKKESGDVLVRMVSQNPVYDTSNIRCMVWHPHCTKMAIAARDDSIRVYTENSQLTPLLKCRGQQCVSSMAWRPLCSAELAVGCAAGVIIWHIDPNSVISRPSAAGTQVLSRPNHTFITSVTWSPQGDLLVSGSAGDNTMYVWSAGSAEAVALHRVGGGGIALLSWSPDSRKLFAATTNTLFRLWDTCQWEADRWSLAAGRVVSCAWSRCGTSLAFAVSSDSLVYTLSCGAAAGVYQSDDMRAVTPLIDVTAIELPSGERVGGEVSSLAWDKNSRYLAISFKDCDIIAIFMTSFTHSLSASPCCFVRGGVNEVPAAIAFEENFKKGANLTIGWSSGRVQYFPIIYTELEAEQDFVGRPTPVFNQSHNSYLTNSLIDYSLM